mmetsp:Transcript_35491/g.54296  ORF Transcript_35491/g.54296 Transcript_35491/m.54296 type:complete len:201 (-) Transcript_35491:6-608(-)
MVSHGVLFLTDLGDGLHETHHGLVAMRVELVVVSRLNALEFIIPILLRQGRDVRLHGVHEVGEETQSVVEVDFERLVIDGRPRPGHWFLRALGASFTESGLGLEFIHEFDFPRIGLGKGEFVILTNNLELIWQLVRAHFVDFEEVDHLRLLVHVEVPLPVELPSQAVNWLISLDRQRGHYDGSKFGQPRRLPGAPVTFHL